MKKTASEFLKKAECILGVSAFVVMFGAISIQIFFRYVLKHPLVWPFELSIFAFVYVIYIGTAIAARNNTHIVFDIIYERFPPRMQKAISILNNLFLVGVIIAVMPATFSYIGFIGSIKSSALQVPWMWLLLAFPIGMCLTTIYLLSTAITQIKEFLHKERQ